MAIETEYLVELHSITSKIKPGLPDPVLIKEIENLYDVCIALLVLISGQTTQDWEDYFNLQKTLTKIPTQANETILIAIVRVDEINRKNIFSNTDWYDDVKHLATILFCYMDNL